MLGGVLPLWGRAIQRSVTWLAPLHLDVSAQLQAAADEQECSLCTAVGRRVAPAAAAVPPALGGALGPPCRAGRLKQVVAMAG